MHSTKILAEFKCGGLAPLGVHPKTYGIGYDVGKISVGCPVYPNIAQTLPKCYYLALQTRCDLY